jgi:hypothetical protein
VIAATQPAVHGCRGTGARDADDRAPVEYRRRMTTPAAASMPALTYARARLFLGTSAVGTVTVLSAAALLLDVPGRLWPTAPGPWAADAAWIALAVALQAAVLAPFDLFAGFLVPREYGRTTERLAGFLRRWWRGALLHGLALTLAATGLMLAARGGGAWGTWAAYLALVLALLAWQPRIAAAVGKTRLRRADGREPWGDLGPRTLVIETPHAHVTGGAYGAPLATAWVWADRWSSAPGRSALDAQALRRSWIARSGARDRGVWLALLWNALPVAVAVAAWGPPVAAADVLRLALLATLGSFVGVLLLPTPSRWAVHHADLAAVAAGADPLRLATALEALDRDQDDEPARSEAVEAIFHPIPSLAHRLAVLNGTRAPGPAAGAAWHAARVALYLSWASGGLLGRAVHCNLGRPEAWVFLPSD